MVRIHGMFLSKKHIVIYVKLFRTRAMGKTHHLPVVNMIYIR